MFLRFVSLATLFTLAGRGTVALETPTMPTDPLAQAPSRFARLKGVRLHYKSLGKGREALVFVHGWSCDLTFWRFQAPAFAAKTRVIALDLPGHGQSDKPETAYTMDLFARAVDAVMRDAGVDRAVLVGHSNGTPVIRQYYRLYPAKTRGLVVIDGNLRPFGEPAQYERFAARFQGADYKKAAANLIDSMFSPQMPADIRDSIRTAMLSTPQNVMVSSLRGLSDPALWKEDPITVPLLVVLAKSPFWTPEYETFVRGLARDVDYRVVDGVGHFLMMEKPDEFNALLTSFLVQKGVLKG